MTTILTHLPNHCPGVAHAGTPDRNDWVAKQVVAPPDLHAAKRAVLEERARQADEALKVRSRLLVEHRRSIEFAIDRYLAGIGAKWIMTYRWPDARPLTLDDREYTLWFDLRPTGHQPIGLRFTCAGDPYRSDSSWQPLDMAWVVRVGQAQLTITDTLGVALVEAEYLSNEIPF